MDRVTFATSSGIVWLALGAHFAAGLVSIGAGTTALLAAKGSALHKRSGMMFTWGMLALGASAVGIGAYESQPSQVSAGLIVLYLVTTATTAVKPMPALGRGLDIVLALFALAFALVTLNAGIAEWRDPTIPVIGRPRVVPPLVIGVILLLASLGDARAIRAGGLQGSRRLARHLWRMCFSLFVATGSFFLGQMKFIPEPVRNIPLLLILGFAPLPFLVYWMWRVRVRGRLTGILLRDSR